MWLTKSQTTFLLNHCLSIFCTFMLLTARVFSATWLCSVCLYFAFPRKWPWYLNRVYRHLDFVMYMRVRTLTLIKEIAYQVWSVLFSTDFQLYFDRGLRTLLCCKCICCDPNNQEGQRIHHGSWQQGLCRRCWNDQGIGASKRPKIIWFLFSKLMI